MKYIREETEEEETEEFDVDPFGDDEDAEMGYLDDDTEEFLYDPILLERVLNFEMSILVRFRIEQNLRREITDCAGFISNIDFDDLYHVLKS